MQTVSAGFATLPLGSAATTKRGPSKTNMDSLLRGNDRNLCDGQVPLARVWKRVSPPPPDQVRGRLHPFLSRDRRGTACCAPTARDACVGCAEGPSPFAGGLRVSPRSFTLPPKSGGSKGVGGGLPRSPLNRTWECSSQTNVIPCALPERGGGARECLGRRGHIKLLPVTRVQ